MLTDPFDERHAADEPPNDERISSAEAARRESRVAAAARKRGEAEARERYQREPEALERLQRENHRLRQEVAVERALAACGMATAGEAWRARAHQLLGEDPEASVEDVVDLVARERDEELGAVRSVRPVQIGSPGSPPAEPVPFDERTEAERLSADMGSRDPLLAEAAYNRARMLTGGR